MKGLAVGLMLAVQGAAFYILSFSDPLEFTLCFDISNVVPLVVLLAIFLLLSKWYTLCERNREINIQAIVEEHYERYMDQEEREHGSLILMLYTLLITNNMLYMKCGVWCVPISSFKHVCVCVCVCVCV